MTGAAGSIGSELCRQIAIYEPETLVLLDKSEGGLYSIDTEIGQKHPLLKKSAALVDIKHTNPLREIFGQFAPQIVVHAAAYKHVPMMEFHPEEAVLNNIVGTVAVGARCDRAQSREVYADFYRQGGQSHQRDGRDQAGCVNCISDALECNARYADTSFSAVRFGNVLGSSGSVLPLFRKQIESGGPVTVTHPEITRYFMTIPEAVQLVLRAVSLAEGGEIFVLEMGEPVKLVDMARNVIRGSGLVPDKDIEIKFIGLRPGEKLHEELVGPGENVQSTGAEKIVKIRSTLHFDSAKLMDRIIEMERLAIQGASKELLEILCEVVPNFRPIGLTGEVDGQLGAVESISVVSSSPTVLPFTTETQAKRSGSRLG